MSCSLEETDANHIVAYRLFPQRPLTISLLNYNWGIVKCSFFPILQHVSSSQRLTFTKETVKQFSAKYGHNGCLQSALAWFKVSRLKKCQNYFKSTVFTFLRYPYVKEKTVVAGCRRTAHVGHSCTLTSHAPNTFIVSLRVRIESNFCPKNKNDEMGPKWLALFKSPQAGI